MKKLLIGLLALIIFKGLAFGLEPTAPFIAIDQHGRTLVGATINVVNTSTGLDVTSSMKADSAGSATFSAVVPQSGIVQFYTDAGTYQVTISGFGVTRTYVVNIPSAATGIEDSDFPSAKLPGHLIATASGVYSALKHNLSASTPPDPSDDTGDNYDVGSIWIDTTNDIAYICADNTLANAVWLEMGEGAVTGGTNLGSGTSVFKNLTGTLLQFKSLLEGDGIDISNDANNITITGPTIAFGTTGTDINISVSGAIYTINIPNASGSARGVITTGTQTIAGAKTATGDWIFDGNPAFNGNVTLGDASADTISVLGTMSVSNTINLQSASIAGTLGVVGATSLAGDVDLGDAAGDTITVTGTATFAEDTTFSGEVTIGGVSGSGKAVCVKADGNLGVCSDAVGGSGTCTCG